MIWSRMTSYQGVRPPLRLVQCVHAPSWASSGTRMPSVLEFHSAYIDCRWACLMVHSRMSHHTHDRVHVYLLLYSCHHLLRHCWEWFTASCFFYRMSQPSVRYNFPSCCSDIDASLNAISASFNRPIRSATYIVDTSKQCLDHDRDLLKARW
jgi:hypothetical protein